MEKNTISKEAREYGRLRYQAGRYHGILTAMDEVKSVYEKEKDFMTALTANQILDEIWDALTGLKLDEEEEYLELQESIK